VNLVSHDSSRSARFLNVDATLVLYFTFLQRHWHLDTVSINAYVTYFHNRWKLESWKKSQKIYFHLNSETENLPNLCHIAQFHSSCYVHTFCFLPISRFLSWIFLMSNNLAFKIILMLDNTLCRSAGELQLEYSTHKKRHLCICQLTIAWFVKNSNPTFF
jgi:hypothetical protein